MNSINGFLNDNEPNEMIPRMKFRFLLISEPEIFQPFLVKNVVLHKQYSWNDRYTTKVFLHYNSEVFKKISNLSGSFNLIFKTLGADGIVLDELNFKHCRVIHCGTSFDYTNNNIAEIVLEIEGRI